MVSLRSILTASAIGCSRPNGPTTFGPLRSCIAARTLRSASVRYATASSNGTTMAKVLINVRTRYPSGEAFRNSMTDWIMIYSAAAATGAAWAATHSAMVGLARLIGSV